MKKGKKLYEGKAKIIYASPEKNLVIQSPERILYVADALRNNFDIDLICKLTGYDRWFIEQIDYIIKLEKELSILKSFW